MRGVIIAVSACVALSVGGCGGGSAHDAANSSAISTVSSSTPATASPETTTTVSQKITSADGTSIAGFRFRLTLESLQTVPENGRYSAPPGELACVATFAITNLQNDRSANIDLAEDVTLWAPDKTGSTRIDGHPYIAENNNWDSADNDANDGASEIAVASGGTVQVERDCLNPTPDTVRGTDLALTVGGDPTLTFPKPHTALMLDGRPHTISFSPTQ